MSDKEKQIEEMAKITCRYKDTCINYKRVCSETKCENLKYAEALYNAGYRKQIEGENIGAVHPVDEFKCSVCGITLEGWSRVITDEDDGELYYYEYEFKYCPNCGAKMKGGESE